MKYAVELASGGTIYIPSLMSISSGSRVINIEGNTSTV
jgi:hypothetical protein